ncbi:MAG: hypothetical protein P1Q69_20570, partial [Candidatus Thorarchaeota archaeon]|nr:hypothetical protein [Candidatus Thorarchaeota archaeon]
MNRLQIIPNHLFAVLNWFIKSNILELKISTPWVNDHLFSLKLDKEKPEGSISINFNKSTFNQVDSIEDLSAFAILKVMQSAGILKAEGWETAFNTLIQYSDRNIFKGERPASIVFDTNMLIGRYYTLVERELLHRVGKKENVRIGYVITQGIRDELATFERKYKATDISRIQECSMGNWFDFSSFRNQLAGNSRMFRLGSVEAYKMILGGRCITLASGRGDDKIIKATSKYQSEQMVDVFAISEDSDFISMCNFRGIQGQRLDPPPLPAMGTNIVTDWRSIADFIYVLSIRLGAIRLGWDNSKNC